MRTHIPIKLPSLANMRVHWRYLARIKKKQRDITRKCLEKLVMPPLPLLVTITRIGPKHLDDDNLASACKYVRDEIAKKVGVDDGSNQYTWRYEQLKGLKYGAIVEITIR